MVNELKNWMELSEVKDEQVKEPAINGLPEGAYDLKIAGEPQAFDFHNADGSVEQRVRLHARIEGKSDSFVWFVKLGKTKGSVYGKLVEFAKANGGKLEGLRLKLMIVGTGIGRRYGLQALK